MAQVDDEIARLNREDGYDVVSRSERLVELEQKHSWLAVLVTGILSGSGQGLNRKNRLFLEVDEQGEAVVRLRRPSATD
jgi:hypothetical protein